MATTATKSTARKSTARTSTARKTTARKSTARTTTTRATAPKPSATPAARRAAEQGTRAARDARAAVTTIVRESGYAYVGAGDMAVAFVRTLPQRAESFASTAGERARSLVISPARLTELARERGERLGKLVEDTRGNVSEQFDTLVVRGRKVVGAVRTSAPTKRAVDQTKIARSQVKAAVTSVRKAVDESGDAVEAAADKLGAQSA